MLGLPCRVEGAMQVCGEACEVVESGDLQTGSSSPGSTEPDCSTGAEMSSVLRLLRSGRPFRGSEPILLVLALFSLIDGVRFTFEINFEKVDLSAVSVVSFDSFSWIWITWASCTWAWGWVDHVGVITLPRLSSVLGWGWWMMGGLFGFVGEGRMIWSLKTARRPFSRGGLKGSASFSVLVASMEDWDTPVEGALAISEAAFGVAF
jgi:hypothetical protein